jgi:plastocyanin
MPSTPRKRAIVLAGLASAATAAVFATTAPASGDHVTIKGSSPVTYHFAPKTLQVQKGDTVHWSWSSNAPHNVTFKKISAHSHTGASESFSHRFKKAGTYRYLCTIHGFRGKIVVG